MSTRDEKPKRSAASKLTTDQRRAAVKYLRAKLRQARRAYLAAKATAKMGAGKWSQQTTDHWYGAMKGLRWALSGLTANGKEG